MKNYRSDIWYSALPVPNLGVPYTYYHRCAQQGGRSNWARPRADIGGNKPLNEDFTICGTQIKQPKQMGCNNMNLIRNESLKGKADFADF